MARTKQTARQRTDPNPHRVVHEEQSPETRWPETRWPKRLFQIRSTLDAYRTTLDYMPSYGGARELVLREIEKLEHKEKQIVDKEEDDDDENEQAEPPSPEFWDGERERIYHLLLDTSAISTDLAREQCEHLMEMDFSRVHHLLNYTIPPESATVRMLLSRGMYIAAYFCPHVEWRDDTHALDLHNFLSGLQSTVAGWRRKFATARCDSVLLQHIHDLAHTLNSHRGFVRGANVTLFEDLCAFAESRMIDLARSAKLAAKNTVEALVLLQTYAAPRELTVKRYRTANRYRIGICSALDEIDDEICFAMRDIEQIVDPWLQTNIKRDGSRHLLQKSREGEDRFNPDHI